MEIVLVPLMAFVVLGSIVALELKDLLSAVIAAGVTGLGLSTLFLLLGAPDIAITQVVVEALVVTVLIRVTSAAGRSDPPRARRDAATFLAGSLLALGILAFLVYGFSGIPAFGAPHAVPSAFYLATSAARTGATNVVTAIVLDFRGYDTLGEATVILAAIAGALVLARHVPGDGEGAPRA